MSEELRTCVTCNQTMPLEPNFRRRANEYVNKDGTPRVYYQRSCKKCVYARQQAYRTGKTPPAFHRMRRINARGDVWCPTCKSYLPSTRFRPHHTRASRLQPYCMDCTRKRDRARYNRAMLDDARWKAECERRTAAKRIARAKEIAERREFVFKAIDTLRRKGLAYADIGDLAGISPQSFINWRKYPDRRISPAAAQRIGTVLTAAIDLPLGTGYLPRTRRADPAVLAMLRQRCSPQVATIKPMRSRWRNREAA